MRNKNIIKLTESELKKIISESVKKVLKENIEEGTLNAACQKLLELGLRESNGYGNEYEYLTVSGKERLQARKTVFAWTIQIGDRMFVSKHNFATESLAERNCNKYLNAINFNELVDGYEEYPSDIDFDNLPKDENGNFDFHAIYNVPEVSAEIIGYWMNRQGKIESDVYASNTDGLWMD